MTRIRGYLGCLLFLISFSSQALDDQSRVAFFYGDNPPFQELHAYNVVVVHPNSNIEPKKYNNSSSQLYAYVSIGEKDVNYSSGRPIDASWQLGKNATWNSRVMDLSNPAWRDFLLNDVFAPLWEKGYHGFFLDTLDSYQLLKLTAAENKEQLAGIVDLVKKIKARFPEANIITNRGFEVLESIHQDINAVAAESLFSGWNNGSKKYVSVSESNRNWLVNELNKVHKLYQLPIIVIDYLPSNNQSNAHKIARQIRALGFIPWVADSFLETLGVGTIEVIPRKVLLLYDALPEDFNTSSITVFDNVAFILEYMGFVPVLQRADQTLSALNLDGTYAGVVTWFSIPVIKNHLELEKWLNKHVKGRVPIVFMQNFGIPLTNSLLQSFGINFNISPDAITNVTISKKDNSIGYEILPKPLVINFLSITSSQGRVLLELTASNNQKQDSIVIAPWGGYVLEPFDIVTLPDSQSRWIVNPFSFFKEALRLPEFPVPDVTTANGKRILTTQIDGDAFISLVPWKGDQYAGELILKQILEHYKIPVTVSIVQREFELLAKNPELQTRLLKAAQRMFALPWVQIATHTYSHPLKWWPLVENQPNTDYLSYPDPSYSFNYEKEIVGSTEFINQNLAPPNKKVELVLWSGDANMQEKPLEIAYGAGLKNINGMSKINLKSNDSITNLGPFGMSIGNYFHVFSPLSNEYEYTADWAPPLYAFDKIIHTFELTESPVRYKPILIYYHFYSAVDQASLRALKRVYDWALKQNVIPLKLTDYIDKVMDFRNTVIARYDDGSWLITNNNSLREFRSPAIKYIPDLGASHNIIGFNHVNKDVYIHLGNTPETRLSITQSLQTRPYLVEANADVVQWDVVNPKLIRFSLQGYVPLRFKLANLQHCQLMQNNQQVVSTNNDDFYIQGASNGTFEIQCNG